MYEIFDAGAADNTPIICDYNAVRRQHDFQCDVKSNSRPPAYCASHTAALDYRSCTRFILLLRFVLFSIHSSCFILPSGRYCWRHIRRRRRRSYCMDSYSICTGLRQKTWAVGHCESKITFFANLLLRRKARNFANWSKFGEITGKNNTVSSFWLTVDNESEKG